MKKQIKYISAGMLAGMLLCGGQLQASNRMTECMYVWRMLFGKITARKYPIVCSVPMR